MSGYIRNIPSLYLFIGPKLFVLHVLPCVVFIIHCFHGVATASVSLVLFEYGVRHDCQPGASRLFKVVFLLFLQSHE